MRISLISIFKPIALSIAAIVVMGLGQGVVRADEVFISGFTNGCFNASATTGCAPVSGAALQTTTLLGLTYRNSTFADTTASGGLSFGGNTSPPVAANFNNLGSLQLVLPATGSHVYNGTSFSLLVTFNDPDEIIGSNTTTFTAVLTGTVTSDGRGGVSINFADTTVFFTFNDTVCGPTTVPGQQTTCGNGSFSFRVNDLSVNPGQAISLSGDITAAQQTAIPEPTSMLLLGTGLAGVAGVLRRKLRARNQN